MAKCVGVELRLLRANTFVGPVARNNPFRPQPPEKVANLEMHEEQEQVTLENVDVQAPEKHTGDLSKLPLRLRQRRGSARRRGSTAVLRLNRRLIDRRLRASQFHQVTPQGHDRGTSTDNQAARSRNRPDRPL